MKTLERLGADRPGVGRGRLPGRPRGPTRTLINRLNVYPVPDGDTGTNMALTLESVVIELDRRGETGPRGASARPSATGRSWERGATPASSSRRSCGASPMPSAPTRRRRPPPPWPTPWTRATDRRLRRRHPSGRGHHPHRRPGRVGGGVRGPSPARGTDLVEVLEAAAAAARRRPWPRRPTCSRCSSRREWWTPAASASCCCSTPSCTWRPGDPCPIHRSARGRPPAVRREAAAPSTPAGRTPSGSPLRGHVLPRGTRRDHPRLP